ncbi:response regulator [Haloarculaceae archaeon H-GB11]|nr:response regulator [Haloarculaceae archaeon H-GB11]
MGLPQDEVRSKERPINVLHVDDDPDLGEVVALRLEQLDENVSVITETNPDEGMASIRTERVDCVVSDYQMPGMNGIEFLREVRAEYPNLPFFLLTGRGSEEVASEAIAAGVTSYLQKGGSEVYERLVNRVQNAVDHRRSEYRAEVARNRLLELYEQTAGFFILDGDWTITYWNQQMVERTDHLVDEVLGESFLDAFSAAEGTELCQHYRRAMESQEPVAFETYYEPHDYWVRVRVFPVEEGLFVHSNEITDEKDREQELRRRNHILKSLANTVSHDLRNPLQVAEGRLQVAQETGDFEHLEAVAQAHNRMRNLIDELLHAARGEEAELVHVSLAESARQAWETVTADEVDLVVEKDVTFGAYESQLRRLFENLFWNAIDHGRASTIWVGTDGDSDIYVEDDGVGIPAEKRESVLDAGVSTDEDNPGYGLAIVEQICGTHGWEIRVTEGREGGARFEITGIESSGDRSSDGPERDQGSERRSRTRTH